jgi:hypothetical protein
VRYVIACGVVVVAVGALYVTHIMPSVDSRSQASSIVTLPDKAESHPPMIQLPQQRAIKAIEISPPVQAVVDETGQDETLYANNMAFVEDNTAERNVGPILDANDMSFVVDDSPRRNVGEVLDADAGF